MTYELTNKEKAEIIDQHIKNINYAIYNFEISLKEEQSLDIPNQDNVSSLNKQLEDSNIKKSALLAELQLVTE